MARMNKGEFIHYCNDRLPEELPRIDANYLTVWVSKGVLKPEEIGEGLFYYEDDYYVVLHLLWGEKALKEKPEQDKAARDKREAKVIERKIVAKEWQDARPEHRQRHNRTYYLQCKRKAKGLSETEEIELSILLSQRVIKRIKT